MTTPTPITLLKSIGNLKNQACRERCNSAIGDWKQLQGSPFWRLRVGGWRIICEIVKKNL